MNFGWRVQNSGGTPRNAHYVSVSTSTFYTAALDARVCTVADKTSIDPLLRPCYS